MTGKVLLDRREDGVRVLTLNDPDRRNTIGPEIQAELADRIGEVSSDPQSQVLVVGGAGTAFCAGADLPSIFGDSGWPVDEMRRKSHEYYQCFLAVLDCHFLPSSSPRARYWRWSELGPMLRYSPSWTPCPVRESNV